MLTKMVDLALSTTFLVVHFLSKFRSRLHAGTTLGAEDHLMAEWIEARRQRFALQSELYRPTASRVHGAQTKLLDAFKVAGEKCHSLAAKLRARRKPL